MRRTLRALISLVTMVGAVTVAATAAHAAPTDLLISEYVEGSSNNKAIELFNGTDAAVDLTAGQYVLQLYFNGSTTAGATVALAGVVAPGDVFVFAHSSSVPAILAVADQTSGIGLFNGDDAIVLRSGGAAGPVLDSFGQVGVDPGTEWGTGLTSTADNTLRRASSVAGGDTDPADAFDPAAGWQGFATDTFDGLGTHAGGGGPVDAPAVLACGGALTLSQGEAGTRVVTATDADDLIVDLAVASVVPSPAGGTISRTAFTPAGAIGGSASATVSADAGLPVGSYLVTLTATDADATVSNCTFAVTVNGVLTVGAVQGPTRASESGVTDRSPLAPATGNSTSSTLYDVQGVITQRTLARTSTGASQYGFFLQSRAGATDGDADSSDGIFVFMGGFTSLIGGYVPTVGDEVVLRARVSEYFFMTQLSSASLVRVVASGVTDVAVTDATPPTQLADAKRFWERHEGARLRIRAGSQLVSGRDVFASTADSELHLVDVDDPLLDRADPLTRRVYRDPHPKDNDTAAGFDDGNGNRIMVGTTGVKWTAQDSTALLPAGRTFDPVTADAVGGLSFSFDKYGIQVESLSINASGGADPSANSAPVAAVRSRELAVATYNVENLYDFRDDPFDGCDYLGNAGCSGVSPPFDYVPLDQADYDGHLAALASQIVTDLHSPDLLLVQEAEDQDICSVVAGAMSCGTVDNADGKPDSLQDLTLAIAAAGGPAYDTAYDRHGSDVRGIVAAFLYRTDRLSLSTPSATDAVLGSAPTVSYRSAGLAYNADVQNPKSLNALLPSDVDTSTGKDGSNVYTRAPQVGRFTVATRPGGAQSYEIWAVTNHFSSGPDGRIGQRKEQAGYGAAIITAIEAADPNARVIYGGDLNVFPRPDDPIATSDSSVPSDQLAALYNQGLHSLWEDLAAAVPGSAYSYVFDGQAQTLDHLFVNDALYSDLLRIRAAHINADFPADHAADGARGASDHDPQVAVFSSRPRLTVSDATAVEGQPLVFTVKVSRPLSAPLTVCLLTIADTAKQGADFTSYAGCLTFAVGQTSATVSVATRADKANDPNERVTLLALADPFVVDYTDLIGSGLIQ